MKFSLYIRGRGNIFELASTLNKYGNLKFLVTSYPKFFVKKFGVPNNKIKSIFILEILVRFLRKINFLFIKININLRPVLIVNWLADLIFSFFYINDADFFLLGFGNSTCKIIKKSKKKNIKTMYFLNNSSPSFRKVIENEYQKLNVLEFYDKEDSILTENINQSIKLADYVGCISSFQRKTYVDEGVNNDKIFTFYSGIDTSVFYPQNLKKEKFIVLAAGNDFIRKGFKYLIDGFNSLKLSNAELWLIGNFDKRLANKVAKIEQNNIIISGVDAFGLAKYYNQASIFCLPTFEDGAGMVLPQAMACGLPAISTKYCIAPDIINDGINGFIIDPINSMNISEKINYFYNNPKKTIEMGSQAATDSKKKLSFDVLTKNLIKFCEGVKN